MELYDIVSNTIIEPADEDKMICTLITEQHGELCQPSVKKIRASIKTCDTGAYDLRSYTYRVYSVVLVLSRRISYRPVAKGAWSSNDFKAADS